MRNTRAQGRSGAALSALSLLLAIGSALPSCTGAVSFSTASRSPALSATLGNSATYVPLFAEASGTPAPSARGSLMADFDWAAGSPTLAEAETRWREFLVEHRPADGEYEDSFAAMHVRAAELELMRVEYLLGKDAEGDALLRKLDPLGLDSGTGP